MYMKFKATYDRNHDTFRMEFLVLPCVVLSLIINHEFTVMEVIFPLGISKYVLVTVIYVSKGSSIP